VTIEPLNNDYDLESIEINTPGPFNVGDTMKGRACFADWLVHFRDPTTLLIAPIEQPDEWRPAHIYSRGGTEGVGWGFILYEDSPAQPDDEDNE
jgi:hypothetical protein